jgi:beta-N-acetylhexosaminidase|tara:strand:+ start:759 stop:1703 length:945 start_codon:yes stop_codon:yes gene_type:complete
MKKKAIIISLKGKFLSKKEKILLSDEKPWGVILFKRNIFSLKQTQNLIKNIKRYSKNKKFPILIDEEGSTVSRIINIFNNNFHANFFGKIFKKDKKISILIYKNYLSSLCKLLSIIGFNMNTIPVLDVLRKSTSKIIGTRSFSDKKDVVKILGDITVRECHKHKIVSVIKHIPGHGCATKDSHKYLPRVSLSKNKLKLIDFFPFKSNPAKLAMTAHILYTKIDTKNVSTFSKKIIKNIIRKKIGFKGILMSDDISMRALKYDLVTNAKKALDAGCNLVLYCEGNIKDNFKLIKSVPYIDKFTVKKTSEIYKILR